MRGEDSMTCHPWGQPTRTHRWVDGATTAGVVHPSACLTSATNARCSRSGADLLAVRAGFSTVTPATCSTYVPTGPREGSTAGTCIVNTDPLHSTSFPCFDGTNPRLWRTQCLEYFNRFNIHECMWVVAATMHMEGKAKVWYEAYRLRQVVGDWTELMDKVESQFGVSDLPPSTTILGVSHVSGGVHASGDISPEISVRCLPMSPKEVLPTAVKPTEPTLTQLLERIKLQFEQLKLALDSEYEERKTKTDLQMSEPIADSSEEVLTHISGTSLFLEIWIEPAEAVCSEMTSIEIADEVFTCIGGSSLFLELDIDSANKVFDDDFLTTVRGISLFLELDMDIDYDAEVLTQVGGLSLFLQKNIDTHRELVEDTNKITCLDHVIGGLELVFLAIPPDEGKQHLLPSEIQQGTDLAALFLPWDPGDWCLLQFVCYTTGIVLERNHVNDNSGDLGERQEVDAWHVLSKIQPCRSSGFSPGESEHQRHDFPYEIICSSINKEIMQQFCGIARLWDLGISTAETYPLLQVSEPQIPLKTLVAVTWLHTYCSDFCDIQSTGLDRKLHYIPWNLSVHNQVIRQVQQELCKCYYFCSLLYLANHLQYKQWDPGVTWIVGAEGIKLCSTQPRGTTYRISWLRRRFLYRS